MFNVSVQNLVADIPAKERRVMDQVKGGRDIDDRGVPNFDREVERIIREDKSRREAFEAERVNVGIGNESARRNDNVRKDGVRGNNVRNNSVRNDNDAASARSRRAATDRNRPVAERASVAEKSRRNSSEHVKPEQIAGKYNTENNAVEISGVLAPERKIPDGNIAIDLREQRREFASDGSAASHLLSQEQLAKVARENHAAANNGAQAVAADDNITGVVIASDDAAAERLAAAQAAAEKVSAESAVIDVRNNQASELVAKALERISELLNIPPESMGMSDAQGLIKFDMENFEQIADVLGMLERICALLDRAAMGGQTLDVSGMQLTAEDAAMLSADLRIEKFHIQMALSHIGAREIVSDIMSEKTGGSASQGIAQATDPSDLGMSALDTARMFSDLIEEDLAAAIERINTSKVAQGGTNAAEAEKFASAQNAVSDSDAMRSQFRERYKVNAEKIAAGNDNNKANVDKVAVGFDADSMRAQFKERYNANVNNIAVDTNVNKSNAESITTGISIDNTNGNNIAASVNTNNIFANAAAGEIDIADVAENKAVAGDVKSEYADKSVAKLNIDLYPVEIRQAIIDTYEKYGNVFMGFDEDGTFNVRAYKDGEVVEAMSFAELDEDTAATILSGTELGKKFMEKHGKYGAKASAVETASADGKDVKKADTNDMLKIENIFKHTLDRKSEDLNKFPPHVRDALREAQAWYAKGETYATMPDDMKAAAASAVLNTHLASIEINGEITYTVIQTSIEITTTTTTTVTVETVEKSAATMSRFDTEAVIRQIVEKMQNVVRTGQGVHEVRMTLKPEALGEIRMSIRVQHDVVFARMVVESQQVKAIVESNMQALKDSLANQNLQAAMINVDVRSDSDDRQAHWNREMAEMTRKHKFRQTHGAQEGTEDLGVMATPVGSDTGRKFGGNTFEYFI